MAEEELRFRAVGTDAGAGRMMDHLAKGADKAGGAVKDLNSDLAKYDQQISETERHLKSLVSEFAKTGDQALFKDVRRDRARLSMLTYLRKQVASDITPAVGNGIMDALSAIPTQLAGKGGVIGAGLGAAMAPFLGAAVGAAVLGGVGMGGIVGGIAAASQDQRVQAAGTDLGESLLASFGRSGEAFVEPLLDQMTRLDGIGANFFAELGADIAPLADDLDGLVDGVEGFTQKLDFGKVVKAAEPIISILGEELPEVAESLTEMFGDIAEEGDGAAIAARQMFDVLEDGIEVTGETIAFLSGLNEKLNESAIGWGLMADAYLDGPAKFAFPWLIPLASGLSDAGEKADSYTQRMIRAKGPTEDLSDGMHGLTTETEKAAGMLQTFSDEIDEAFGKRMSMDEATLRYKQGVVDLTKELGEGERTLGNTQAGRDNAQNVLDWLSNIEAVRAATVRQTGDVATANTVYEQQVKQLRDVMVAMGFSKKAADELVAAYLKIPRNIETTHTFRELYPDAGFKRAERDASEHRAMGGPVIAGRSYVINEHGPEAVTFGENGRVLSPAQSAGLMSGASGGAASAPTKVHLEISIAPGRNDDFFHWLIPNLQIGVVGQGGIVQDVLGRIGG